MLRWESIDTVFLDMDGTLLDLHFDNHFWLSHVPRRYAERHGLSYDEARARLTTRYEAVAGTMQWYCVDYWTRELGLDILRLKQEIQHLISVHPHVVPFLRAVRGGGKRAVLVTNAHHRSLTLKVRRTGIHRHLDAVVCAHDMGMPKENPEFWKRLAWRVAYEPARTLLVDDSLPVLRSARDYGLGHLVAVRRPDSTRPEQSIGEFLSVSGFGELLPEGRIASAPESER